MVEAYKQVVTKNYANFSGRASRSEFWWFALANVIIILGFSTLLWATDDRAGFIFVAVLVVYIIYWLAVLLPGFAVTVRRLHDTDKSAWWLLTLFIPYIGAIILMILLALKTHPQPNDYGPPTDWTDDMISQESQMDGH